MNGLFSAPPRRHPLPEAANSRIGQARFLGRLLPIIAFIFAAATVSPAQTQSASVSGGGTLTWTLQVQYGYCGSEYQTVADNFYSFAYTPSGGSATSLSGSIFYVYSCDSGYGNISGGWDYETNSYSSDNWSNQLALSWGQCTIDFDADIGGGGSASLSCPPTVQGYVDLKYVVLGITYAPPGPQSYVTYTNSSGVGITNSLISTLSSLW
jgi:hypothetical protein